MSKIKNGGLDQYGAKPFEQQQFRTPGVERVKGHPLNLVDFCNILFTVVKRLEMRLKLAELTLDGRIPVGLTP